jgi:hypothetical protein
MTAVLTTESGGVYTAVAPVPAWFEVKHNVASHSLVFAVTEPLPSDPVAATQYYVKVTLSDGLLSNVYYVDLQVK